jgi:hypothetical protein
MAVRELHANGGEGDDSLLVRHAFTAGLLALQGGDGDGVDQIALDHVRSHAALIETGAGSDHVRITNSAFHLLAVALGEGDDLLEVRGNKAIWALLMGGEGTDTLEGLDGNRFVHKHVVGFELPDEEDGL